MVNYYELLGIAQDANRITIEQAIKKIEDFGITVQIVQMPQLEQRQSAMYAKLLKPKKFF